jgi:hypothetical protein
MKQHTGWRTIGFAAAPPGWRVSFFQNDGTLSFDDVAGWLIQEEVGVREYTYQGLYHEPDSECRPEVRVVAAYVNKGEAVPVTNASSLNGIAYNGPEDALCRPDDRLDRQWSLCDCRK